MRWGAAVAPADFVTSNMGRGAKAIGVKNKVGFILQRSNVERVPSLFRKSQAGAKGKEASGKPVYFC